MLPPMYRGDERPAWVPTVIVNGVADDMTSGYTFQVKLVAEDGTVTVTKTSGITGGPGGTVTVAWSGNELDIAPGIYTTQLKATRTSDSAEWTITDRLPIKARS